MKCKKIQAWYGKRGLENYRHSMQHRAVWCGIIKSEAQDWHWRPYSCKELNTEQSNSCTVETRPKLVSKATKRKKEYYLTYIKPIIHSKFRCAVELQKSKNI